MMSTLSIGNRIAVTDELDISRHPFLPFVHQAPRRILTNRHGSERQTRNGPETRHNPHGAFRGPALQASQPKQVIPVGEGQLACVPQRRVLHKIRKRVEDPRRVRPVGERTKHQHGGAGRSSSSATWDASARRRQTTTHAVRLAPTHDGCHECKRVQREFSLCGRKRHVRMSAILLGSERFAGDPLARAQDRH